MRFAGCDGQGNIVCPTCNANQEPRFYKENQMTEFPACYGRGLIAHRDGSDTKWVVYLLMIHLSVYAVKSCFKL